MKFPIVFLPLFLGCAPHLEFPPLPTPDVTDAHVAVEVAVEVAVQETATDTPVPDVGSDTLPEAALEDVQEAGVDAQDVVAMADAGTDIPDVADTPDVVDVGADTPDARESGADAADATETEAEVADVPVVPVDLGPPPCPSGEDRCGGMVCRSLLTDPSNCGGCGNVCPARPNAPATCSGGSCTLVCNPGTLNCDGSLTNGCETVPSGDILNCGACGVACTARPHTAPSLCVGGTCSFACGSGYANCDGNLINGCEVATDWDPMHCGGCGRACGTGLTCVGGSCVCPSGQAPCGGRCPDLATDEENCGACGMACAAGQGCCAGVCRSLQSDRFNCGACGTRCASPTTCNAGVCGCTGSLDLCGSACVDTGSDPRNCGWCGHLCYGIAPRCVSSHCTA